MRHLVLPVSIAAIFALGCESAPKDRLQGTWRGVTVENLPEAQADKASGWARNTKLEFEGNRVTVSVPAETPRTGKFTIAKSEGERLVVAFQREGGGQDEVEFRFTNQDEMRWNLGGGREMVLHRAD